MAVFAYSFPDERAAAKPLRAAASFKPHFGNEEQKTSVICADLRNLKHQLPCEKRSAMKGSGCGSCRYAVTAPRLKVCAFAQCIPRSALWFKKVVNLMRYLR